LYGIRIQGTSEVHVQPSARRYAAGDTVTTRELATIRSDRVTVPDPDRLTHLQFRRYAGCPICNVHLRSVTRRHDEIAAAGIHEVAVFHSAAQDMLPHQGELPFDVVADPDRVLYAEFGVESSVRGLLHPSAWTTPLRPAAWAVVLRGRRAGGSPSPTRGETVTGLPADFLIEPDGHVRAAKYGRHANDQWSVDELLRVAARTHH
jgi:peroxiredoxin